MRPTGSGAALLFLATLVPSISTATTRIGPVVSPLAPGRVRVAFESSSDEPAPLVLKSPGLPSRRIAGSGGSGIQRFDLDGLEPGREYRYESDGIAARFVAPPDATQDVRFVVFGDARSGDAVHRQIVASAAARRPDFYVTTGDLVPDGNSVAAWRNFFAIEAPLMSTTPFLTARGNHDGASLQFERMISVPPATRRQDVTYGSLDIGAVHLLFVDTESPVSVGSEQYEFVRRDLSSNREKPLVVVLHKPLFSSGRHGGEPAVHDALAPLFQEYGVDIVFQGHDHHYERSRPINGVTYVVTGGAGATLFGAAGAPWTAVKESSFHYVEVEASATRLRVVATRLDGTRLDAFEVDPRANAHLEYAHATTLPPAGGGGCGMIFFGRERGERFGPFGLILPSFAMVAIRRGRRRRSA